MQAQLADRELQAAQAQEEQEKLQRELDDSLDFLADEMERVRQLEAQMREGIILFLFFGVGGGRWGCNQLQRCTISNCELVFTRFDIVLKPTLFCQVFLLHVKHGGSIS